MIVLKTGYNWHYFDEKVFNSDKNNQKYILYVFYMPTKIEISGNTLDLDYGNAMIIQSNKYHRVFSETGHFIIDWIEFSMSDTDLSIINCLEIPFNEKIEIKKIEIITAMMLSCSYIEYLNNDKNQQTLSQIIMAILFCISSLLDHSKENHELRIKYPEIVELRKRIFENPQYDWNLKMMCKMTHCSASKLQKIYKKFYSTSCKDDVITSRIYFAQGLIRSTTMSISEIADLILMNIFLVHLKKRSDIHQENIVI